MYLYENTGEEQYALVVERFLDKWMNADGIEYTPDGLAWLRMPGPLRYTGDQNTVDSRYLELAYLE